MKIIYVKNLTKDEARKGMNDLIELFYDKYIGYAVCQVCSIEEILVHEGIVQSQRKSVRCWTGVYMKSVG